MTMTLERKQEFLNQLMELFDDIIEIKEEASAKSAAPTPIELLTIKECTQVFNGLTEHTIRQLVAQDKIRYIRVGEKGKRGKILIPKSALLEYLKISA